MLKKIFKKLTLALTLTLFIAPIAFAEYFDIQHFHSDIQIQEGSSFTVTETIELEFSESRHGIFRYIPTKGGIEIEFLNVTDEQGRDRPHELFYGRDYTEVKIGDPDAYVSGEQTYEITYNVYNAIRTHENGGELGLSEQYDELYWNVNGNDWEVDTEKVSATVQLPPSLFNGSETFLSTCYTGYDQSANQDCHYEQNGNVMNFEANRKLYSYQGLTIVLGMPTGRLKTPSVMQLETSPEKANTLINGQKKCQSPCEVFLAQGENTLTIKKWGYETIEEKIEIDQAESIKKTYSLTPLFWLRGLQVAFILFLLFIVINPLYVFFKKGRDPQGRGTLIPQYESPDEMTPAEMGTLYDEKVHLHDLTSTIIDLCVRGYMKIKELPKEKGLFKKEDYELIRVNNKEGWDKGLNEFERLFMKRIFGSSGHRKLSTMTNDFYKVLPQLKKMLYKNLVKKGYMPKDPSKVRGNYMAKGFLLFFLGSVSTVIMFAFQIPLFWLAIGPTFTLSGILSFIFAFFMPQKTEKGRLAYDHILGFKMYLETAERDRVQFQEKENLFYKFLPYAMTLKIADKWSEAFKNIYNNPPEWYVGISPNHFNPVNFTSRLNGLNRQMGQTFSSRPSNSSSGYSGSSGFSGGFSGGGFGGGGGGSW